MLTHVVRLTPAGRGAIASLLVVGADAVPIVDGLLRLPRGRTLANVPTGAICYGRWQSASAGEEVVVCRREATRVEIHCHGGAAAVSAIVESLCAQECRELDWRQWLLASSSDPLAAAAEIALTQAPTERTAAILWEQRNGALRHAVEAIDALARDGNVGDALASVARLLALAPVGRHLVEPWRVVFAGRPNVGKSSLINALVGYERAIVHATPGTTRDVVVAASALDGWPLELSDTAGLRGTDEPLESAGMELTRQRMAQADLVLLVFDASSAWTAEDEELAATWPAALPVFNKCDLRSDDADAQIWGDGVSTSATRGDGLDVLARTIVGRLVPVLPAAGEGVPFLAEHVDALSRVAALLLAGQVEAARVVLAEPPFCRVRGS